MEVHVPVNMTSRTMARKFLQSQYKLVSGILLKYCSNCCNPQQLLCNAIANGKCGEKACADSCARADVAHVNATTNGLRVSLQQLSIALDLSELLQAHSAHM